MRFLPFLFVALLAGLSGWFAARYRPSSVGGAPAKDRRPLYYQSAMHPWIKSDAPGRCTICGMELTPIYEGDAGFGSAPGMVTLGSNTITVLGVRTAPARRGPLLRTLRVAGTLEEDETRHRVIAATVAGRIDDLRVNFTGTEVLEGQPLARFYSPMLLEAERQFAALHRSEISAAPSAERDLLRDAAAQRLRQLGLTEPQILAIASKSPTNFHSDIVAPASGTVVGRYVYPGQYVMEGEKLFELADFSTLWFRFDAYEQDLPWIQVGQEVEVITPSVPGRSFRAPIRFIDPNLADQTRSAKVRVELTNPVVNVGGQPARLLRGRLFAEARVEVRTPEVLLLPRSAVLSADAQPVVYLDRTGGVYEQRRIRLGRVGDHDWEVLEGLEPGDPVVTTGNLLIDAQAQLNLAIHQADPGHAHAPETETNSALPKLSEPQLGVIQGFLKRADAVRAALAADDLATFNTAAAALPESATPLAAAFEGTPESGWLTPVNAVARQARLQPLPAPDLRAARRAYHALSVPLVDLVRRLARSGAPGELAELRLYQCPMTGEAFDGAPTRAQWFQFGGPLRNPWFGAEMLECGVEVKP